MRVCVCMAAIPPDTTLPSPSPGKMVAAGASESDLEILSRASSMIVKAATTLLTHAFGGAVRPVPASPSGTPTAATSSTASMILSPVAGSAAAGSGPDFRSDGTVDAGYVSGTVALLLDLFIRPALGGSVTDKSLNALFQVRGRCFVLESSRAENRSGVLVVAGVHAASRGLQRTNQTEGVAHAACHACRASSSS